jgi:alkanesulfonate monooxygenase SsuD/methylene tetrahydromethanopterin reductase-like flavin-dependent oxidoreductase (luciferase family)
VLCAPDHDEAQWLAGPSALAILQLRSGKLGRLPSPEEAEAYEYSSAEAAVVAEVTSTHLVGDPEQVHDGLVDLQRRTAADEIMLSTRAHSFDARARSLALIADRFTAEPAPARTA